MVVVDGNVWSALAAQPTTSSRPCDSAVGHSGFLHMATGSGKTMTFFKHLSALSGRAPRQADSLVSVEKSRSIEGKLDADVSSDRWAGVIAQLPFLSADTFASQNSRSVLPAWASRVRLRSAAECRREVPLGVIFLVEGAKLAFRWTTLILRVGFVKRLLDAHWVALVKRVDSAVMSILQRVTSAARWIATAPACPPGEAVISSARVPRGPNVPRVTPVLVTRGEQYTLA